MSRYVIPLLAIALIGCQSSHSNPPNASTANYNYPANSENGAVPATQPSSPEQMNAERAAYAARVHYPIGQAADDLHLTALVDRGHSDQIRIVNPTDSTVDNASIWVNGKYVTYVAHIPPHSVLKLDRNQFFDNGGHALSEGNTQADHITVQVGDRLFNVMGPAFQ